MWEHFYHHAWLVFLLVIQILKNITKQYIHQYPLKTHIKPKKGDHIQSPPKLLEQQT